VLLNDDNYQAMGRLTPEDVRFPLLTFHRQLTSLAAWLPVQGT
jgi:hypothetical protein